jgi:hypothetical protein
MDVQNTVVEDLKTELGITAIDDVQVLALKVKNAVSEVKNRRSYPSHFTEEKIQKDLGLLYSNIHDLALYDYNQSGVEGQTGHSENGESRTWKSRDDCLKGVFAWAGF